MRDVNVECMRPTGVKSGLLMDARAGLKMEPCIDKVGSLDNLQVEAGDDWKLIHPTPKTMIFKEILMGNFGYTEGQGVYNAVRSTEAVIRQIQATILTNTLNAAKYDDLMRDWRAHLDERGVSATSIATIYGNHGEAEAVRVAEQLFNTWYKTLHMSLLDFLRGIAACFSASESNGTASFAKYVDWIVCLGMVPLQRLPMRPPQRGNDIGRSHQSIGCVDERYLSMRLHVAHNILREGVASLTELTTCAHGVSIMDYDRVHLFYNYKRREVRAVDPVTGIEGECLVLWQPIWYDGVVLFDSPLQRLHSEVLNCHTLREHARLCQILNTSPVKVLIGKRSEEERGAWASKAVDKILSDGGEAAAGSSAARLVKLIVNMKGMRHIGDITETVRSYLDETNNHILNGPQVDTSQPGFGQTTKRGSSVQGAQPVQDAFRTSVLNSINGMLEGYINNLFKTIEGLKADKNGLLDRLQSTERELKNVSERALRATQAAVDVQRSGYAATPSMAIGEFAHEVIDVSGSMGEDSYVANSFQARYIPPYSADLDRLSRLWDQELVRCFKMNRTANNQGQEMSVSYSNSSISLILAPYFFSILKVRRLGFLITHQEVYRSEEELCASIFKKTRLEVYLTELLTLFTANVKAAVTYKVAYIANVSEPKDPDIEKYLSLPFKTRSWRRSTENHGNRRIQRVSRRRHIRDMSHKSDIHPGYRARSYVARST
nr:capsid portal protein [Felid alphaherpesvirus 1]